MTLTPPAAPKATLTSLPDVDDDFEDYSANLSSTEQYELNLGLFHDSISTDRPYVSEIVPIAELREEYEKGSATFVQQIDYLANVKGYHSIRRTRGDGDCFYRALAFAFVERLLYDPNRSSSIPLALKVLGSAAKTLRLEAVGFPSVVYEDCDETFVNLISNLKLKPNEDEMELTAATLLQEFQSKTINDSIVMFLRLVTSAVIRLCDREDPLAVVLQDRDNGEPIDQKSFCERFVEPMGREADHTEVIALSRALKLNIVIAYLDGRSAEVSFHHLGQEGEGTGSDIVLLYRPGHYDILVDRR